MRAHIAGLVIGSVLLAACGPPAAARPREGAPVAVVGETKRVDVGIVAPPTPAPAALGATPVLSAPGPPRPEPSPTMPPAHVIAATGGMAVNLRAAPPMTAPVIATLREGTPVEALGEPVSAEGLQWQQIHTGDREGWVVAVVVHQW